MTDISDLLAEANRRARHFTIADEVCFDRQLDVIRDPSRRKAIFTPRRCLAEGTLVMCPGGPVAIENLGPGDWVYSGTGQPTRVTKAFSNGVRECVALRRRQRDFLVCTPDHEVHVVSRNKHKAKKPRRPKTRPAGALKSDDGLGLMFVAAPLGPVAEPHAYVIGAMLGDGCCNQSTKCCFYISSKDERVPSKCARLLDTEFKGQHHTNYTWQLRRADREPIQCNWYDDWCRGRRAHEKFVDIGVVKTWDRNSLLEFVAGLMDTDGCMYASPRDNSLSISLSMQASTVVDAFEYAVMALWQMQCSRSVDSRSRYKNGPVLRASLKSTLHAKRALSELSGHMVVSERRDVSKYPDLDSSDKLDLAGVSTSHRGPLNVYDIEVECDTHSYLLANGAKVNNCGKSTAIGILLLQEALAFPRRKNLYIGLTGEAAYSIIFTEIIQRECDRRRIHIKYNATTRTITFRNGSTIKLAGMDSSPRDMDKLLGGKYHCVVVDECQSFTQDLRTMIKDRLAPAMADYIKSGGGIIVLAGTPGTVMGDHFWYQITKQTRAGLPDPDRERGWKVHEWDVPSNPFMAEQFTQVCKEEEELYGPAYVDRPEFKRQWLGKWVIDVGSKAFKFSKYHNVADDMEIVRSLVNGDRSWNYIVGVDLGFEDATAIVLGAYKNTDPNLYIVSSKKMTKAIASTVGMELQGLMNTFAVKRMAVDTGGGASRQFAESLAAEYKLPILAAKKTEKENAVGMLNSDMLAGRIKIITVGGANKDLIDELERLTIDEKLMREQGKWRIGDKYDDHLCMAMTYMWRDSLHQHSVIPDLAPEPSLASMLLSDKKRQRPMWEDADPWDAWDEEQEAKRLIKELS